MTPAVRLPGSYGVFTRNNGVELRVTASALRTLADLVRKVDGRSGTLDEPPPDWVEEDVPITAVVARDDDDVVVSFRREDTVLAIVGGSTARELLAETLADLALEVGRLDEPVAPHFDLAYFPGHSWLGPESGWMTVALVAG